MTEYYDTGGQADDNPLQEVYDATMAMEPGLERETALRGLWHRIQAVVTEQGRRRLPGSVVDDAAQEALIGVFRSLDRSSRTSNAPLDARARRIAANKAVDQHRSLSRRSEIEYDDRQQAQVAAGMTGEDSVLEAESSERVDRLLSCLSPRQRAAVYLTTIVGMSVAEAAAASDTSAGAITAAKHRGRRRLAAIARLPDDQLPPPYSQKKAPSTEADIQPTTKDGPSDEQPAPAEQHAVAIKAPPERAEVLQPYVTAMFRMLLFPDKPRTIDAITCHLAGTLNRYQAWARSGEPAWWFDHMLQQAERHVELFMRTDLALGRLLDPDTGDEYAADHDSRLIYAACISRLIGVSTAALYLKQRNSRLVYEQAEILRHRMAEPVDIPEDLEPHHVARAVTS